jgi:hypothetical protein
LKQHFNVCAKYTAIDMCKFAEKYKGYRSDSGSTKSIFRKETKIVVECDDLASLITEKYNINSEIQATLELNEEVFEFDVNKEEFNQTDWDNMRKSISHSDFYNIVNKLSVDGFIEDGDYLLKVY